MLTYEWDPESTSTTQPRYGQNTFDLGPHPADPLANIAIAPNHDSRTNGHSSTSHMKRDTVPGHEIWVYVGNQGYVAMSIRFDMQLEDTKSSTFTFWRFSIQIPLSNQETSVRYSINNGQEFGFFLPGRNQNMRWATYSVNIALDPGELPYSNQTSV